jgi:hypothetical protein
MSKQCGPPIWPVARHEFSPVQTRPGTVGYGPGPARPVYRAGYGQIRRPVGFGPARHDKWVGPTAARIFDNTSASSADPIPLNGPKPSASSAGPTLDSLHNPNRLTLSPTADPESPIPHSPTPTPSLLSVWRRRRHFLSASLPSARPPLPARPARRRRSCIVLALLASAPCGRVGISCSAARPAACWPARRLVGPARLLGLLPSAPCSSVMHSALVLALLLTVVLGCSPLRPADGWGSRARTARLCALLVGRALVLALLVSRSRLLASAPCSSVVHSCSPCSSFHICINMILSCELINEFCCLNICK